MPNPKVPVAAEGMAEAKQRVERIAHDLQEALIALGEGAVRFTVGSDHPPAFQHLNHLPVLNGRPLVGVPPQLWRTRMLGPQLPLPEIEVLTVARPADPLLDMLTAYRRDVAAFNALADDASNDELDAHRNETWGRFYLSVRDDPETLPAAATLKGAILALCILRDEDNLEGFDRALLASALAYFDVRCGHDGHTCAKGLHSVDTPSRSTPDPLLDLIQRHNATEARFRAIGDAQAAERTAGEEWDALWFKLRDRAPAATSTAGALAALALAEADMKDRGADGVAPAMVSAALAYFNRSA